MKLPRPHRGGAPASTWPRPDPVDVRVSIDPAELGLCLRCQDEARVEVPFAVWGKRCVREAGYLHGRRWRRHGGRVAPPS